MGARTAILCRCQLANAKLGTYNKSTLLLISMCEIYTQLFSHHTALLWTADTCSLYIIHMRYILQNHIKTPMRDPAASQSP